MYHFFKAVPSLNHPGFFLAECSISSYRPLDKVSGQPRQFKSQSTVAAFSRLNTLSCLSPELFKHCANKLLAHHGALLLYEDPCETGSQKCFRLHTRFGPAEVTPVDTWVIFRFLEPEGKSFPWGMKQNSGSWNIHSSEGNLSALLEDLAEGLAKCIAPSAKIKLADEARCELLPPAVMKSGAGYYVGCFCKTADGEYPHSRFSDYFRQPEQAQTWLSSALESGSL